MTARERNKNLRYLRIQEMWKFLSKERRLASDFCHEAICEFFAIEEQTVAMALKSDIVADVTFRAFDQDKKWLDEYVRKATSKQEKRKDEKGGKNLFGDELP